MLGTAGGGGPAAAGLPAQLQGGPATASLYGGDGNPFVNSLGTLPQGGNYANSQLFGGGGAPAPGGYATSQLYGQFNPASQNYPAYLQSLFRRGRRGQR
jgi:hypothetical protein